MNKKLTIFSVILIIIGMIGTISFSISSIPYVVDTLKGIESDMKKETIIFDEELDINKLNIDTQNNNVVVKNHNKNSIIVTQTGISERFDYNIKYENNELSIIKTNNSPIVDYNQINNLDSLVEYLKKNIYQNDITIYLPVGVEINSTNQEEYLQIYQ